MYNSTVVFVVTHAALKKTPELYRVLGNKWNTLDTKDGYNVYTWDWTDWYFTGAELSKLLDSCVVDELDYLLLRDGESDNDWETRGLYNDCDIRIGIIFPNKVQVLPNTIKMIGIMGLVLTGIGAFGVLAMVLFSHGCS